MRIESPDGSLEVYDIVGLEGGYRADCQPCDRYGWRATVEATPEHTATDLLVMAALEARRKAGGYAQIKAECVELETKAEELREKLKSF